MEDKQRKALARAADEMTLRRQRIEKTERDAGGFLEAAVALSWPGLPADWGGEGDDPRTDQEKRRLHFRSDCLQKRLVFADWCEEMGLAPRAELIRQQIDGTLGPLTVKLRDVTTPDGTRSIFVVEDCNGVCSLGGEDFWPGAALDAARDVVRLPFFDWALVEGGFVDAVRFREYAAAVSYVPVLAAALPVTAIHYPGAEPLETYGRWYWGADDNRELSGRHDDVLKLDGSEGFIPWQIRHQTRDFHDFESRTFGGFLSAERALYALYRGVARWGAIVAYVNGLFPVPLVVGGEGGFRRHASRPRSLGV